MGYMPVPPPEPPRRTARTRTVVIIVAIVVALCCGGGSVGGYVAYRAAKGAVSSISAASLAADTFLRHLTQGETDAAYDQLCAQTQQNYTRDRFTQTVNARPKPARYSITNTNVSNMNGSDSATVTAVVSYPDGSTDNHTFHLVNENGWKICGDPY